MIAKEDVLGIINTVMIDKNIKSIRDAILAIRHGVLTIPDNNYLGFEPVTLRLRGNNGLCEIKPHFADAEFVRIRTWDKVDTGIYGTIEYLKNKED